MSQPTHISEILLKVAADPTDPFAKVLRRCPFIQAELIHRKLMALNTERMPSVDVKVCGGLIAYVDCNHT